MEKSKHFSPIDDGYACDAVGTLLLTGMILHEDDTPPAGKQKCMELIDAVMDALQGRGFSRALELRQMLVNNLSSKKHKIKLCEAAIRALGSKEFAALMKRVHGVDLSWKPKATADAPFRLSTGNIVANFPQRRSFNILQNKPPQS